MFIGEEPIHMNAPKGSIAPLVLMPGDPLRAKYIAKKYLENPQLVTDLRNMLGFTGTYKGKKVTVMGHGMGMPSVSIYAFELFHFYDVKKVIRIGTCGVVSKDVDIPDLILASDVYTDSNFGYSYNSYTGNIAMPSDDLNEDIIKTAKEKNQKLHVGTIMTTDVFGPYIDIEAKMSEVPESIKPLAEEMEGFALLHIAATMDRDAAVLVTAVDSKFSDKVISPEDRQNSLNEMIELALDSIIC